MPAEREDVGPQQFVVGQQQTADLACRCGVNARRVERGEAGGSANERLPVHSGDGRGEVKTFRHGAEERPVSERSSGVGEHPRPEGVGPAAQADRYAVAIDDHVAALERARILNWHHARPCRQPSKGRPEDGIDLNAPGCDSGPRHHDCRRSIGEGWRQRDQRVRDERGVGKVRFLRKTQQWQARVLERRAERGVLLSRP